MNYRKKPVVIKAKCFTTNNEPNDVVMNDIVDWVNSGIGINKCYHNGTDIYIPTLEGEMKASVGDYIINGVNGEFYPCKPDIFHKTYDKVD